MFLNGLGIYMRLDSSGEMKESCPVANDMPESNTLCYVEIMDAHN